MLSRLEAQDRYAPLLSDQQFGWLWDLFQGLGESWCDAGRDHPRHGTTVRALLQLAAALHTGDEAERRSSLEVARAYLDDALAGKAPKPHLTEVRDALADKTAEIVASLRARRDGAQGSA